MNNAADLVTTAAASAVPSSVDSAALKDNVGALSPAPTERDSASDSDVTLDYGGEADDDANQSIMSERLFSRQRLPFGLSTL